MKCSLTANYGTSSTVIKNKIITANGRQYSAINISYSPHRDTNVIFNDNKVSGNSGDAIQCMVSLPPIHTYNSKAPDGEFIIKHTGSSTPLWICIPIIQGNNTNSLQTILSSNNLKLIDNGQEKSISTLYSLNEFIPLGKPFYTYNGSINNSTDKIDVVAYNINHAINLSSESINIIKSFIQGQLFSTAYPICKSVGNFECATLYVNKSGATNSKSDDIFIDCQPTGSSGKTIVHTNKEIKLPDLKKLVGFKIDIPTEAIIVGIISGIAAITIINNIFNHRKWYNTRNIM